MSETCKNVLVHYMSIIQKNAEKLPYGYEVIPSDDAPKSLQTNETCIRYLQSEGIVFDKIFAFVTDEAAKEALPHLEKLLGKDIIIPIVADQDDNAYACMKRMAEMMKKL